MENNAMGIFIILILLIIVLWWRMMADLRQRTVVVRTLVSAVLLVISILLLRTIYNMINFKGNFDEPSNVFTNLEFGSLAGLVAATCGFYLIVSIITLILRRIFRKRLSGLVWTNLIVALVIIALFADAHFRQRFTLTVAREEIGVKDLDPGLDGLRIVFVSDLHLSSFYRHYEVLSEMVDSINNLEPDILVNGGDFISYGWGEYGSSDTILVKARAAYGAFAVAGNHDDGTYFPGYTPQYGSECTKVLQDKIRSSGLLLLTDSSVTRPVRGVPVRVAGVVTYGHHLNVSYGDFDKALPSGTDSILTILVLHNPVGWDSVLTRHDAPQLTLSGHTHGMQAGLPVPGRIISPASLFHKYWKGLYEKDNRYLFVSTGIGSMGMTARIFMPPEIVLLTLRKK